MKEDKSFCRLCGKYRNEKLSPLILGEVIEGVTTSTMACSLCHTISHNIQFAFKQAQLEYRRREQEKAISILKEKGGVQLNAST